jgi:hypothetical protein
MQDGPMRPASRMNDASGMTFQQFFVLLLTFGMMVGANCTAIWLMRP